MPDHARTGRSRKVDWAVTGGAAAAVIAPFISSVYGLNGAGKTTLANYLYAPDAPEFAACRTVPTDSESILVYSQKFIRDNFYEADGLRGIFSLSETNRAAGQRIANAEVQIKALEESLFEEGAKLAKLRSEFASQKQAAVTEICIRRRS